MPIIAKMLITLITSVDMFICTCTFSSVPSTKCDVYFVFFFLFITQTTPICNQKGEKSKKKTSQKFLKMVGGAIVSACFCLLSPSILQSLALLSASAVILHTFRPLNVSLIPQWIKARMNCHDFMLIFVLPSRFRSQTNPMICALNVIA